MRNPATKDNAELEAVEQREWREALDYVIQQGDRGRTERLLATVRHHARMAGVALPFTAVTAYVNTIRSDEDTPLPGSQEVERRIKSLIRWNAMAMVVRANRMSDGIGGHISTYASAAIPGGNSANPARSAGLRRTRANTCRAKHGPGRRSGRRHRAPRARA